jgi:hypothetical protein
MGKKVEEEEEEEEKETSEDVQCVHHHDSIFLLSPFVLLSLSLFSNTINIMMTFVPIIVFYTFVHNTI